MAQDSMLPQDEQFPLLKPDSGGDVKKQIQNPSTVITSAWNVTCTPKKTWCSRWPHLLSTCWMSVMLLVISFLVFYALGLSIGVYGRQPVMILRCNDSKPAGNVYYHHLVPNENTLNFKTFSDYISHMATLYPSLRFHVNFLMDDSAQNSLVLSKSLVFKRLIPQVSRTLHLMVGQNNVRIIQEFQRKYQNVNVSVFYLSKYMATTPLKFKWRKIPQNYLPFYARIYEVWRNGGIGLDLLTHNYHFNVHKKIDHRIDAILKQHNDGINLNMYAETLEKFASQEKNELITTVLDLFNVFKQGGSSSNIDFSTDIELLDKPAIRTHRSRRDINDIAINDYNSLDNKTVAGKLNVNLTANNITNPQTNHSPLTNTKTINETLNNNNTNIANITQNVEQNANSTNNLKNNTANINDDGMRSHPPQFYFVYDFSPFIDDSPFAPAIFKSEFAVYDIPSANVMKANKNFVTLNSDGTFVAGTSRNHPFLIKLISSGCSSMNPLIAIQDTYRKHCSNIIFNDVYCDSVRILYNL